MAVPMTFELVSHTSDSRNMLTWPSCSTGGSRCNSLALPSFSMPVLVSFQGSVGWSDGCLEFLRCTARVRCWSLRLALQSWILSCSLKESKNVSEIHLSLFLGVRQQGQGNIDFPGRGYKEGDWSQDKVPYLNLNIHMLHSVPRAHPRLRLHLSGGGNNLTLSISWPSV